MEKALKELDRLIEWYDVHFKPYAQELRNIKGALLEDKPEVEPQYAVDDIIEANFAINRYDCGIRITEIKSPLVSAGFSPIRKLRIRKKDGHISDITEVKLPTFMTGSPAMLAIKKAEKYSIEKELAEKYPDFKIGDRVRHVPTQKNCEIVDIMDGQKPYLLKYMTNTAWYSMTCTREDIEAIEVTL